MIDLSADMGEGSPGEDEIWPLIDSANVACGGHTGDADSMTYAARRAREVGVRLGAHPSYPDRENFGRKSMSMAPAALRASLAAQIGALRAIAPIVFVKPHGALYNDAHRDVIRAGVIIDAMTDVDRNLAIVYQVELRQSIKFMEHFSSTLLRDYLSQIRAGLDAAGVRAPLTIMQSSGGVMSTTDATGWSA